MCKLVSVIMSVYNEEDRWLKESINSILKQTYSNFEFIIMVDNPKCQRIISLLAEYKEKDNRIKVIINENNMGLVSSLNKALSYCNGYYIARMDADDISHTNRFEKQITYLEKNNLDFVMSYIDKIDENGKILKEEKKLTTISTDKFKKMMKYYNISTHPTWFLKKEIYNKLNGYRDISRCEDYDFILRALQEGYRVSKMDESLLLYRIRKNSITQSHVLEQYLNTKFLRIKYSQNFKIAFIEREDIEDEYVNLEDSKLDGFNESYYFFKKNQFIKVIFYLIKDNIFREYFFYNLKLKLIALKFRRGEK